MGRIHALGWLTLRGAIALLAFLLVVFGGSCWYLTAFGMGRF